MKNYLLIISLVLAGCQTVLTDVEVPEIETKIVFFGNYTNLKLTNDVSATYSKPILNSSSSAGFETVKDLTIKVTGNGTELNHFYDPLIDAYTYPLPMDFIPGKDYKLLITNSDGTEITAQEQMPAAISNFTHTYKLQTNEFEDILEFEFEMDDNENDTNYYRIEVFATLEKDTLNLYTDFDYFDDRRAENGKIKGKFTTYFWSEGLGENTEYYVVVSHINKSHYIFGKALEDYNPDNPFSEPVPLPNNIEGGLGLFSLSNSHMVKLK